MLFRQALEGIIWSGSDVVMMRLAAARGTGLVGALEGPEEAEDMCC